MGRFKLCITKPFEPPSAECDLVVFTSQNKFAADENTKEYISSCCEYAKQHKVYLVPERFILANFIAMCLIDSNGSVAGIQQAIHINLSHKNKFNKGESANVYETPFGSIFLCVDTDIYKPEVLRTAACKGAQIVVSSQFILECDYDFNKIYFGAYNAALSNGFFVINTNNNTSSVIGPIISDDNDGFAVSPMRRLPITVSLNTDYLQKYKFSDNIFDNMNKKICGKYSNKLWG